MANTDPRPPLSGEQQTAPGTGLPATNSAALDELPPTPAQPALLPPHEQGEQGIAPVTTPAIPATTLPVIAVRNLAKTYILGGKTRVPALQGLSLEVYPGEFVAIMGPSGSGKSTFMNLVGGLDRPTEGDYWLAGNLVSHMTNDKLALMRNRLVGFVFQSFNLLGRATALRNVALPMVYSGLSRRERERRAYKVLQLVGLGERVNHKPSELSGGQQQRVAIARALVNGPALLLADEPTGNLDSHTSVEILAILQALNEQGLTIVLVTHDPKVAQYARRIVTFLDGRIVRDEAVAQPRSALEEWSALVETTSVESEQVREEALKEETP
jgi:putative ABC transport system ATP-binding protein